MRILVTGGAGFIGSALVRHLIRETRHEVLNLDALTYAGNLESLADVEDDPRYRFERADICDAAAVRRAFEAFHPDAVMHLAAESHVDRSIDGPGAFVQTNVVGTYTLLEEARAQWARLAEPDRQRARFLHVSTDEVFGALGAEGAFTEDTPYDPSSPYSATKAASDHLVRAWGRTFGVPVLITNCSNNYGPYQYPEKLVPVVVNRALRGESIPVYGKGENVRDWLYVDDHARALVRVLEAGEPGETYAVGGRAERTNLQVVEAICDVLDTLRPDAAPHRQLVTFVTDRPGHDFRYAIDPAKIAAALGWEPRETFESGLAQTVRWYAENGGWCKRALAGRYDLGRLGTGAPA